MKKFFMAIALCLMCAVSFATQHTYVKCANSIEDYPSELLIDTAEVIIVYELGNNIVGIFNPNVSSKYAYITRKTNDSVIVCDDNYSFYVNGSQNYYFVSKSGSGALNIGSTMLSGTRRPISAVKYANGFILNYSTYFLRWYVIGAEQYFTYDNLNSVNTSNTNYLFSIYRCRNNTTPTPTNGTTYVHDTVYVTNTNTIYVHDTVTKYDTKTEHDTVYVKSTETVYVHDTINQLYIDTVCVHYHDTVNITQNIYVTDTAYLVQNIYITDTAYITQNIYLHDTTYMTQNVYIHDTVTFTENVYLHDTSYITQNIYVHDTAYIEVNNYLTDTVYEYITDTIYETIYLEADGTALTYNLTDYGITYFFGKIMNVNGLTIKLYSADGKLIEVSNTDISMANKPTGVYLVTDGKGGFYKFLY